MPAVPHLQKTGDALLQVDARDILVPDREDLPDAASHPVDKERSALKGVHLRGLIYEPVGGRSLAGLNRELGGGYLGRTESGWIEH